MLKKLNNKLNNKKGFTLMEMLIVVAIIAVLVAIAIPTFNGALTKAKQSADVANVRAEYAEAQIKILTENDSIPTTFTVAGLNYPDKLEYVAGTGTITYTADKLDGSPFVWVLGDPTIE